MSKFFVKGSFEYFDVVLFNPFVEEFTGNLDIECIVFKLYGNNRIKPGFESLRVNIILNEPQTFFQTDSAVCCINCRLNSCFFVVRRGAMV